MTFPDVTVLFSCQKLTKAMLVTRVWASEKEPKTHTVFSFTELPCIIERNKMAFLHTRTFNVTFNAFICIESIFSWTFI